MMEWMVLGMVLGCTAPVDTGVMLYEGDDAGECSDAADNDRDGLFDCDDTDCLGSPDCVEDADADTDTDTDTDADTDTDTDTDPTAVANHLTSFSLSYTLVWDFDAAWEFYGLLDCAMTFEGAGEQDSAAGTAVTFLGTWEKTGDDCNSDLADAIWTSPDGVGYSTFVFAEDLSTLNTWVAHSAASDSGKDSSEEQFYITDMSAALLSNSVSHTESEDIYDGGYLLATLTHELSVSFFE